MDFDQFERICMALSRYFLQVEPEPSHFHDWIDSLQEPAKAIYRKKGFAACRDTINFRRFVAELQDAGLEEHMQRHLSGEDYRKWQQI